MLVAYKSAASIIFFILNLSVEAVRVSFEIEEEKCVMFTSGPDCPKQYRIGGGPSYYGTQRENHPARLTCSSSCTKNENKRECSLIVVLHGTRMNPGGMEWLMIGSERTFGELDTFHEDASYGGPYCVAFVKSAADAWDYDCFGSDSDYVNGFVNLVRDDWPIDHEAVFLHGFSSGGIQLHNWMNTACVRIEPLIAAFASYGSGNVFTPPTTAAAFLVVAGTHDNIVPYKNRWIDGKSYPSCDCNAPGFEQPGGCLNGQDYYFLQGEELALSTANLRGNNDTDLFSSAATPPPVSRRLDLIKNDDVVAACDAVVAACEGPYAIDDTGHDSCDALPDDETDVLEYPTTDATAGPVQLWRINLHDHDYPNKRRRGDDEEEAVVGPTEFLFELRRFFDDHRGRRVRPGKRVVVDAGGAVCSDPAWYEMLAPTPERRFVRLFDEPANEITSEWCRDYCFAEKLCTDAFFVDSFTVGNKYCQIFYGDHTPCSATTVSAGATHYRATVSFEPTSAPTEFAPTSSTDAEEFNNDEDVFLYLLLGGSGAIAIALFVCCCIILNPFVI